jgi:pyrroline-5-carboxylate reductase
VRVRTSSRAWLALTPEPERELPAALAVLRAGGSVPEVEREIERAEALVLRGREPAYLAWLCEAAALAARRADSDDPAVADAARVVRDIVRNQAGLLLGLPGGGRRRDRARRALEVA